MKQKVIFLYDRTGLMAEPWLQAGYECWLFDGQHPDGVTRDGNLVKVGMWFYPDMVQEHAAAIAALVGPGVKLVFGFPECTDLTVAGARHWQAKALVNPRFQQDAADLASLPRLVGELCWAAWAYENPIGRLSTLHRKPDFIFDPCEFGGYLPEGDVHPLYPEVYPPRDAYNKRTCIWCGGGFVEPTRKPVPPLSADNPGWRKCGGKSLKTKNIRSATPRGFSLAVFADNAAEAAAAAMAA